MDKKDIKQNEKDNFLEDFEDWHNNKYNDEYRYRNKTPFFYKTLNHVKLGILLLIIPFLSLIVFIILDFGIGFYLFCLLMAIPGVYTIVKHFTK